MDPSNSNTKINHFQNNFTKKIKKKYIFMNKKKRVFCMHLRRKLALLWEIGFLVVLRKKGFKGEICGVFEIGCFRERNTERKMGKGGIGLSLWCCDDNFELFFWNFAAVFFFYNQIKFINYLYLRQIFSSFTHAPNYRVGENMYAQTVT